MTSVTAARKPHLISWDVVRVLALAAVLLFHSTYLGVRLSPELGERPVTFPWQVGASMLLLISGYFMSLSLRKGDVLRWWAGRLARLLPSYFAAVLVTSVVLRYLAPPGWWHPDLTVVLENFAMLWNWSPETVPFVDPAYWTLPLQLIWFSVVFVLWRWRGMHGRAATATLYGVLAAQYALWPLRMTWHHETFVMLHDGLGFPRVHLFVAGVAVHRWATGRMTARAFLPLAALCLGAHEFEVQETSWTAGIAVGLVLVCLAARGPDWGRFIPPRAARVITWLASVSYGIYLVHQQIGYRIMWWLADWGVGPLGQEVAFFGAAVLLGWLLTVLVERPAHRLLMWAFDALRARVAGEEVPHQVVGGKVAVHHAQR